MPQIMEPEAAGGVLGDTRANVPAGPIHWDS
jgi:hypothetical protein